ncbi:MULTISPECIES: CNNM domain-containing protein [Myroides]|uniref:DUF21 domain-containing protein n=1 Tax=Myroides albus TaxID=2562892 RepID=A0A6I3LGM9_9FLAO|nr:MULTISPECIES: CNNM domain-containing protein [Myroides]MTG97638.1 DUF21 domain-containing protein [Myroides albus]MVX36742.1 DUF21 domain-containing protein [Myroides sp. LoEW2-1]UVD79264.1 CNNM domain-containing protein [Myroides albus]
MTLLLVYLGLALSISFICSIAEAVLLSLPVSFLKSKHQNGDSRAGKMLALKEDIDKPLSAILSLNTVAHTVGAAGVGAQASIVFGDAYFGVVSAVLTLLILVLTEIIPKTIGANYAKKLYGIIATTISAMVVLCYPLVILSSVVTRSLSKNKEESTTSREEISMLASIGEQEGILKGKESKIIQNIIKLDTVQVSDIITPRIVMVSANEQMSLREFLKEKEFLYFSRIPIYQGHKDNVTGYILREQVFEYLAEDKFDLKLKDLKRELIHFSEKMSVISVWGKFIEKREHIGIALNEYGEVEGLVTLEDIIETLLGFEIVDEKDKIVDLRQYAYDRWQSKKKKYEYLDSQDENNA